MATSICVFILSCLITVCHGTEFPSVYHIIHTVACTTYQWDATAGIIVILASAQRAVCVKSAFGTGVGPAYNGSVNCSIDFTSGGMGVTVTFCFYNIIPADSGVYQVTTSGQQRNGTVFVMNKPTLPQISPTTVEAGRQETLTCTSTSTSTPSPTGQAMIYTWRVNNAALSDPRFSTSGNTLTINTVRREDKDTLFQCTARENKGLSSDTTGIRLTVHYPPQGKPVVSYGTLTYLTGSAVTLSCTLTEDGYPQAIWTWRCGSRTFNSGITNSFGRSNLTFVVTKTDNNQPCTCTASSSVESYSKTSDPATLNIRYPPQGKPLMSYSTMIYLTGSTVTLSCSITEDGNPQATWTWRCGSRTFNNGITNFVGRSNLTFVVTKIDNNQPCTCTASSSVGLYSQTSDPATLDIRYPPQGKPVISYSTLAYLTGSTVLLSCIITEDGNPQANWTWRCGIRTFNSGITNSLGRSNLTFVVTKTDNSKPCTCTASSSVGQYSQTSDPATLDIRYPPQGKPMMSYSTMTYLTGNSVTLSCSLLEDGNPQASWAWRCGSRTFNSGITNSVGRSNLTFVVTKTDNNQPCTCTASSSVGSYSQTSDPVTLTVKYPPEGIPHFINPVLIYNESNTVSFTCSLSSNGNPSASWIWTIASRNFTSDYITNTGIQSTLRFEIRKADNGRVCRCRAVSSHVSYDEFNEITLDVRYPSKILSLFPSSQNISENQILSVIAMVEGNPYPAVQWINDDNKTTLMTDNTKNNISVLRFDRINCLDTATYTVQTYNGYGDTDSRNIYISVLCPPRSIQTSKLPRKVVVKEDKMLHISFLFVGNPMPTNKWYFRKNQISNNISLEDSTILLDTKRIGKVTYETTLKRNVTSEDFGEYFAELKNSHGDVTIMFEVVTQGRPDPPTNIVVDCSTPLKARLYWVSQFNGLGEKEQQHFYILYKINGTDTFAVSSKAATESGWGRNLTGSLKLNSGAWLFEIEARNAFGSTQSVSDTSCYVKDTAVDPPESLTSDTSKMAGMYFAGLFSSVLIFGSILLIIFLKRKGWWLSESQKRTDNTYDSIQTSSREPNTYDDLSKNKQKDSNVYMNTSFRN